MPHLDRHLGQVVRVAHLGGDVEPDGEGRVEGLYVIRYSLGFDLKSVYLGYSSACPLYPSELVEPRLLSPLTPPEACRVLDGGISEADAADPTLLEDLLQQQRLQGGVQLLACVGGGRG